MSLQTRSILDWHTGSLTETAVGPNATGPAPTATVDPEIGAAPMP